MTTITAADAYEILAVVTVCHHRTAPRMDDPDVASVTARTWARLLSGFGLTTAEYVAAVEKRAKGCPEAPEPADLIRVARSTRQDEMGRDVDYHRQGEHESDYHPGDELAAPEPPEYPSEWTTEQRLTAYWYAIRLKAMPTTTRGWLTILDQAEAEHEKRAADRDGVTR